MRARNLVSSFFVLGSLAATLAVGCGSPNYSRGPEVSGADAGADAGPVGPGSLKCDATEAEVYGDPGDLSALANGAVIKCKDDGILTKEQMKSTLKAIDSEPSSTGKPDAASFRNSRGRDPSRTRTSTGALRRSRRNAPRRAQPALGRHGLLPVTPVGEKLPLVPSRAAARAGPDLRARRQQGGAIQTTDNKDGNYVHKTTSRSRTRSRARLAVVATDNAGYSPSLRKASNLPFGLRASRRRRRSFLDSAYRSRRPSATRP